MSTPTDMDDQVAAAAEDAIRRLRLRRPDATDEQQRSDVESLLAELGPHASHRKLGLAVVRRWRRRRTAELGPHAVFTHEPHDDGLRRTIAAAFEEVAVHADRHALPIDTVTLEAAAFDRAGPSFAARGREGRREARRLIAAWQRRTIARQEAAARARREEMTS